MHPLKNGRNNDAPAREVVVADPLFNPTSPLNSRPDCPDGQEKDIRDFKVFLKKNLGFQNPGPELLVKIHQRIDAIKLEE